MVSKLLLLTLLFDLVNACAHVLLFSQNDVDGSARHAQRSAELCDELADAKGTFTAIRTLRRDQLNAVLLLIFY